MFNAEDVIDLFFDEPWKKITAASLAGATVIGGGYHMYNANRHIYMMRSAAAEQTTRAVQSRFGRDWRRSEAHFDIPETFADKDRDQRYRRQFFDAAKDLTERTALTMPNVRATLSRTRREADNARYNARLTGREEFTQHRALTACHPSDWNCTPMYREGVEVRVQYKYTTRDWECVSHNSKGCTRHAYVTNTHYKWRKGVAMSENVTGEGRIMRIPAARFMYNAMADARNYALTRSDGAKLARERKAFHQPITLSRHLGMPGAPASAAPAPTDW